MKDSGQGFYYYARKDTESLPATEDEVREMYYRSHSSPRLAIAPGFVREEAGMTLVVILECQDCGQEFLASPRLRVERCFPSRDAKTRQRRVLNGPPCLMLG